MEGERPFSALGGGPGVVGYGGGSHFDSIRIPLMSSGDRFRAAFAGQPKEPITLAEFRSLMKVAESDYENPDLREISMLVFSTGLRVEELIDLRWKDVDLDRHEISVPGNRYCDARTAPFGSQVAAILRTRKEREPASDCVLGRSPIRSLHDLSELLRTLSTRVLRRPIDLHTFREAFLIRWRIAGGHGAQLALITGSAPIRFSQAGQSIEPLYAEAAKFQAWLESNV